MTIGDYIKEKLSIWSVEFSDAMISLELGKINLIASETITAETKIDEFFYNVIPDIISSPKSVSEGGFSISYDKDALLKYYSMMAKKLGKPDLINTSNTITDITSKW